MTKNKPDISPAQRRGIHNRVIYNSENTYTREGNLSIDAELESCSTIFFVCE